MDNREGQEKSTPQWIRESKPQTTEVLAKGIVSDLIGGNAPGAYQMIVARLSSWREAIEGAALRSVAGGEPPECRCKCGRECPCVCHDGVFDKPRCGKNMGNDLLVIPCDLAKGHNGPCERNVWPVNGGEQSELEKLLNIIRTWMKTESGPTLAKFSNPALNVQITIKGYKKIILERTFPKLPAPPQGKQI